MPFRLCLPPEAQFRTIHPSCNIRLSLGYAEVLADLPSTAASWLPAGERNTIGCVSLAGVLWMRLVTFYSHIESLDRSRYKMLPTEPHSVALLSHGPVKHNYGVNNTQAIGPTRPTMSPDAHSRVPTTLNEPHRRKNPPVHISFVHVPPSPCTLCFASHTHLQPLLSRRQ